MDAFGLQKRSGNFLLNMTGRILSQSELLEISPQSQFEVPYGVTFYIERQVIGELINKQGIRSSEGFDLAYFLEPLGNRGNSKVERTKITFYQIPNQIISEEGMKLIRAGFGDG